MLFLARSLGTSTKGWGWRKAGQFFFVFVFVGVIWVSEGVQTAPARCPVSPLPPPDGVVRCTCGLLVLQLQQKPERGRTEGCAIRVNQTLLKDRFHTVG